MSTGRRSEFNDYSHAEFRTSGLTIGSSGTLNAFIGVIKYIAGADLALGVKTVGPSSASDILDVADVIVGILYRNTSVDYIVGGVVVSTSSLTTANTTGGRVIVYDNLLGSDAGVSLLAGRTRDAYVDLSHAQGSTVSAVKGTGDYDPSLYTQVVSIEWPQQWMYIEMLDGATNNIFEEHIELAPIFWRNVIGFEVLTDTDPLGGDV